MKKKEACDEQPGGSLSSPSRRRKKGANRKTDEDDDEEEEAEQGGKGAKGAGDKGKKNWHEDDKEPDQEEEYEEGEEALESPTTKPKRSKAGSSKSVGGKGKKKVGSPKGRLGIQGKKSRSKSSSKGPSLMEGGGTEEGQQQSVASPRKGSEGKAVRKAQRSLVVKRWKKAVVQTIKSRLYAMIQDVHSGKWDQDQELRELREARAKGISAKQRRGWERDEAAESKHKVKKAKHECHLWSRVGDYHFEDKEYADALEAFNQAKSLGQISGQQWLNLARCHMELFNADPSNPEGLQSALEAYQHTLDHLTLSTTRSFTRRLPRTLLEVSRVYESYGAFEGALSLLGMIIENFGSQAEDREGVDAKTDEEGEEDDSSFEQALLRSVLIMKHLSTFEGAPSEELLQRCAQFLEKLMTDLEAKGGRRTAGEAEDVSSKGAMRGSSVTTASISSGCGMARHEELLTLLYARVCELQGTQLGFMKAVEGYQRLFALRKGRYRDSESIKDRKANNAGKYTTWDQWFADPKTWDELAQELMAEGATMLSIEMSQRREQIQPYEDIPSLLSLASAHLSFHDVDSAVSYASRAWQADPYQKDTRALLRKISDEFKEVFELEEKAIAKIQRRWRLRAWHASNIEKYRSSLVEAWEAELKRRPYFRSVRDKLAYFARAKWRRVFLYQDLAATKIAYWFRARIHYVKFFKTLREKHVRELAFLYGKWRKKPFNPTTRVEVRQAAAHRYTPANHRIHQLVALLNTEDDALVRIQSTVRMWRARTRFRKDLGQQKQRAHRKRKRILHRIMDHFRVLVAMRQHQRLRLERTAANTIALFVQKRMRGYWCRQAYARRLARIRWEKQDVIARDAAARQIQKNWRGFCSRRMVSRWKESVLEIQRRLRGHQARRRIAMIRTGFARKIQQTWRRKVAREQFKGLVQTLLHDSKKRGAMRPVVERMARPVEAGKKDSLQGVSRVFVERMAVAMASGGEWYRPMGIFASSPAFRHALSVPALVFAPAFAPTPPELPESQGGGGGEGGPPTVSTSFKSGDLRMLANFISYTQGKGNQVSGQQEEQSPSGASMKTVRRDELEVKTLVLCQADLSDDAAVESLAKSLPRAKNLQTLAVGDCTMTMQGLGSLCRELLISYHVEEVLLDGLSPATDDANEEAMAALAGDFFLQRFGHLQRLSLCRNGLTDIAGKRLAQAMVSPAWTLVSLCLAENSLSDKVGVAIGEALGDNRCLVELDVSANQLESRAGAAFAKSLATNTTLRRLLLRRNLIRDDVSSVFKAALEVNDTLMELGIEGNLFRADKEVGLRQVMAMRKRRAVTDRTTAKNRRVADPLVYRPSVLPRGHRFRPVGLWGKEEGDGGRGGKRRKLASLLGDKDIKAASRRRRRRSQRQQEEEETAGEGGAEEGSSNLLVTTGYERQQGSDGEAGRMMELVETLASDKMMAGTRGGDTMVMTARQEEQQGEGGRGAAMAW